MDVQLTTSQNSVTPARPDAQTKAAPRQAPDSGKVLPAGGDRKPPPPPPKLEKAVQQIKSFLSESQRTLQFRVDKQSGRTVITVINPRTQETIRQIPEEQVLRLAAEMQRRGPGFISETV